MCGSRHRRDRPATGTSASPASSVTSELWRTDPREVSGRGTAAIDAWISGLKQAASLWMVFRGVAPDSGAARSTWIRSVAGLAIGSNGCSKMMRIGGNHGRTPGRQMCRIAVVSALWRQFPDAFNAPLHCRMEWCPPPRSRLLSSPPCSNPQGWRTQPRGHRLMPMPGPTMRVFGLSTGRVATMQRPDGPCRVRVGDAPDLNVDL